MLTRRVTRKRKLNYARIVQGESESNSSSEGSDEDDMKKRKIRANNHEFARKMTILDTWSNHWSNYNLRKGEAYPGTEAERIMKRLQKINCPFCRKTFTSLGGLQYHYARCNIESCYKCKMCYPPMGVRTRGKLLRHMIQAHYTDLPALNDDQTRLAKKYLNSTCLIEDRKGKETIGEQEAQCNTETYVKFRGCDLISRPILLENLKSRSFHEWSTCRQNWELLSSDSDRKRFTPPEKDSVRFKSTIEAEWDILSVGESLVLNEDITDRNNNSNSSINSFIFYTGGVSTCAAWLPRPSNIPGARELNEEYIVIAVNSCPMDKSVFYKDCKDITGCIQFWSTTLANTASNSAKPSLEYMIGHNFGAISEMLWCPLGTSFEMPTDTKPADFLPRLGLLALACGDGQVRIISVPHLRYLLLRSFPGSHRQIDDLDAIPMFKVTPTAILMPPGSSTDQQPVVCTALTWNVEDNQRLIAAGYSNGTAALFNLDNFSPILYSTQGNSHVYKPYKMWLAHWSPVVGVGLLENNIDRILIATTDRTPNVRSSSNLDPCVTSGRAPVTRLIWDFRMRGEMESSEASLANFINRHLVANGSAGFGVYKRCATVWGLANPVITNAVAISDEAGEVSVSPTGCWFLDTFSLFKMIPRAKKSGSQLFKKSSNSSSEVVVLDEANEDLYMEDVYTNAGSSVANKPDNLLLPNDAVKTYADLKKSHGLEFHQDDFGACPRADSMNNIYRDGVRDYPFSSIRHLSWSPNTNSFSHLLSVSHIGLCRIDRVQVLEQIYKGNLDKSTN